MERRGKDLAKLRNVVETLRNRQALDPGRRDHALTGDWSGYRDCHIDPDWILIYERTDAELRLMRTGTHSDLGL
jgi:mRNA interferase YafQ